MPRPRGPRRPPSAPRSPRAPSPDGSTRAKGDVGEARAADLLASSGYLLLERNYSCRGGEIDLVARDGDVLCFIEVRARMDGRHGDALETIGASKQRRIALAAAHYLATRSITDTACRFDVVTFTGTDAPIVIKDAFTIA